MEDTLNLDPSAVQAQLGRILSSPEFVSAGRLRGLLHYTVEKTLAGESDRLKETVLGIEVFQRSPAYDPRLDPVVRVMAGRLRQRLDRYYQKNGAADPIWIEYPKGAYIPKFGDRKLLSPLPEPCLRPPPEPSLAVLPLENMSSDPDQEFFADGMTEAILTGIAKMPGLRVISRTSVMQFKRSQLPLTEIAQLLDVEHIIEGSVLRADNRVRITAQLIRFGPERHVWAESYERDLSHVLTLQAEVSHQIAHQVHQVLTRHGTEPPPALPLQKLDRDAYLQVLRGRACVRTGTIAGARASIAHYQEAIRLRPGFGPAYAALSEAYWFLIHYEYRKDLLQPARDAALRALELDPNLADAQVGILLSHVTDWRWAEAIPLARQDIAQNPGDPRLHSIYGHLLLRFGDSEAAVQELRTAYQLDPLSPHMNDDLGMVLFRARRFEEALEQMESTVDMFPHVQQARLHLGIAYVQAGRTAEAIAEFEWLREQTSGAPDSFGVLGAAYAQAGRTSEAEACLNVLEQRLAKGDFVSPHSIAHVCRALGRNQEALNWVEKAFEQRSFLVEYLRVDPIWDSLRDEPRFQALIDRLPGPLSGG